MKLTSKTIYFILLIFGFSKVAFAQSMAAGEWNAQASFKLNGIPMPPSHSTECLTADEAKDARATIEKSLNRNSCKLTSWSVKQKKLQAKVSCKNDTYDAKGELSGLFDKKSYDLAGEITGTHKIFGDATAEVEFSGRWVSACEKKKK